MLHYIMHYVCDHINNYILLHINSDLLYMNNVNYYI